MRKNYTLGTGSKDVYFELALGTAGIAQSLVFLSSDPSSYKKIGESSEDSGNVAEIKLENSDDLHGKFLQVRTTIDFGTMDESQWPQLGDTIYCEYRLWGGAEGESKFEYDADDKAASDDKRIVVIDKFIDLI